MTITITVQQLTKTNHEQFVDTVANALIKLFDCDVNDLPDNYSQHCSWGLLHLLETRELADYYLLFVNNQLWAGAGGIVRTHNQEKVYQAGFRGFSCATFIHRGLGMKSLLHQWVTKQQIIDAQQQNCNSVVISFNDHNKRLFEVTYKYIMPRAMPDIVWTATSKPVIFNTVPQWLLIHQIETHND